MTIYSIWCIQPTHYGNDNYCNVDHQHGPVDWYTNTFSILRFSTKCNCERKVRVVRGLINKCTSYAVAKHTIDISKRLAGSMKVLARVDIVVIVTDRARSALKREHHQLLNPLLWVATNKVERSVVLLSSINTVCEHITYPPGEAVTISSDIAMGSSRPWSFNNKTDRYPSSGIKKNWSKNPVAIAHLLCTCWRRCLTSTVADIPKMSRNSSMLVNISE